MPLENNPEEAVFRRNFPRIQQQLNLADKILDYAYSKEMITATGRLRIIRSQSPEDQVEQFFDQIKRGGGKDWFRLLVAGLQQCATRGNRELGEALQQAHDVALRGVQARHPKTAPVLGEGPELAPPASTGQDTPSPNSRVAKKSQTTTTAPQPTNSPAANRVECATPMKNRRKRSSAHVSVDIITAFLIVEGTISYLEEGDRLEISAGLYWRQVLYKAKWLCCPHQLQVSRAYSAVSNDSYRMLDGSLVHIQSCLSATPQDTSGFSREDLEEVRNGIDRMKAELVAKLYDTPTLLGTNQEGTATCSGATQQSEVKAPSQYPQPTASSAPKYGYQSPDWEDQDLLRQESIMSTEGGSDMVVGAASKPATDVYSERPVDPPLAGGRSHTQREEGDEKFPDSVTGLLRQGKSVSARAEGLPFSTNSAGPAAGVQRKDANVAVHLQSSKVKENQSLHPYGVGGQPPNIITESPSAGTEFQSNTSSRQCGHQLDGEQRAQTNQDVPYRPSHSLPGCGGPSPRREVSHHPWTADASSTVYSGEQVRRANATTPIQVQHHDQPGVLKVSRPSRPISDCLHVSRGCAATPMHTSPASSAEFRSAPAAGLQRQKTVEDMEDRTCVSFRLRPLWPKNPNLYWRILLDWGVDSTTVKNVDVAPREAEEEGGQGVYHFFMTVASLDSVYPLIEEGLVIFDERVRLEIDDGVVEMLLVSSCTSWTFSISEEDVRYMMAQHGRVVCRPARIVLNLGGYTKPSCTFRVFIVLKVDSVLRQLATLAADQCGGQAVRFIAWGRHRLAVKRK